MTASRNDSSQSYRLIKHSWTGLPMATRQECSGRFRDCDTTFVVALSPFVSHCCEAGRDCGVRNLKVLRLPILTAVPIIDVASNTILFDAVPFLNFAFELISFASDLIKIIVS